MPVDLIKLETKLSALKEKTGTKVKEQNVNIPFLGGTGYSSTTFDTYKNKLVTALENCRGNTEAQVITKRTNAYNLLSAGAKTEANKVINKTGVANLTNLTGTDLDKLGEIILYTYILS